MAVEDHPLFREWERILDVFREALARYEADRTVANWLDLQKAIADLEEISTKLD